MGQRCASIDPETEGLEGERFGDRTVQEVLGSPPAFPPLGRLIRAWRLEVLQVPGWAWDAVLLFLLLAVTGLAYGDHLSYWWTGPDTFTLVATSQLASWGDLWSLLTEPLMAGSRFTEVALFYRPVASLTYTLDWALWGMDPAGYHATNLVLHAAAVVLTYALARKLLKGSRVPAALAAGLFTLHPVISESLPAISRRQDALATALLLGALLAYLHARRGPATDRGWHVASLVLAVLAFGAKEATLLLPGLVAAHAWLLDENAPDPTLSRARIAWSVRRVLPFALVWGGYVAWRTAVLGGLGGYTLRPELFSLMMAWQEGQFVTGLLTPLRALQIHLELTGTGLARLLAGTALVLELGALALYRGRFEALCEDLAALLDTRAGRVTLFAGAWLLGGALLFLVGRTFTLWSAYQFVVPLSMAVSILLCHAALAVARAVRRAPRELLAPPASLALAAVLLLSTLVASTLAYSPALLGEQDWRANGEVQREMLGQLSREVQPMEGEVTEIYAHGLTWWHAPSWGKPERVETVFYFNDFTVEDWLYLTSDGQYRPDVILVTPGHLERWPAQVDVDVTRTGPHTADLQLSYHPMPTAGQTGAPVDASLR